jgi:hypothetical protein
METVASYEVRSPFLCDIFPCHWVIGDVEKMDTSTTLPKKSSSSETWEIFITLHGIAL